MKTLIIIDPQNDFMPGGALAVPGGNQIIPVINSLQTHFDLVVATQDWHPQNHMSFAANQPGHKEFEVMELNGYQQTLWPNHCVQGTNGAAMHSDLNTDRVESIIRKGVDYRVDSYSAFYDNNQQRKTGMAGFLRDRGAHELFFCGLAADFCVYFSILDALKEGFVATLFTDATKPIDADSYAKQLPKLKAAGVKIIESAEFLTSK